MLDPGGNSRARGMTVALFEGTEFGLQTCPHHFSLERDLQKLSLQATADAQGGAIR